MKKSLRKFLIKIVSHHGDFLIVSKSEIREISIDIAEAQKTLCCLEIYPDNAPLITDEFFKN